MNPLSEMKKLFDETTIARAPEKLKVLEHLPTIPLIEKINVQKKRLSSQIREHKEAFNNMMQPNNDYQLRLEDLWRTTDLTKGTQRRPQKKRFPIKQQLVEEEKVDHALKNIFRQIEQAKMEASFGYKKRSKKSRKRT